MKKKGGERVEELRKYSIEDMKGKRRDEEGARQKWQEERVKGFNRSYLIW